MRSLDYLQIAGRDIRRQPIRSMLTIGALTLGVILVISLVTLSLNARHLIINAFSPDKSLNTITVTASKVAGVGSIFGNVQEANTQNTKLTDNSVSQLAALPDVTSAVPRSHIWEFKNFRIAGTDKDFVAQTDAVKAGSIPLVAGRAFSDDTVHEVIVGYAYAKSLGFAKQPQGLLGRAVTITTQNGYRGEGAQIPSPLDTTADNDAFNQTPTTLTATVVGVSSEGSNQNELFVPIEWGRAIRTFNAWLYNNDKASHVGNIRTAPYDAIADHKATDQMAQDGYTTIIVTAKDATSVPGVATTIDKLGYGEISAYELVQRVTTASNIMWLVFGAVASIALIAGTLGIANTMFMVVSEQRYSIAVWRALGATRGHILRQFLLHAALLGLTSGLIGAGTSVYISRIINNHIVSLAQSQGLAQTTLISPPLWLIASATGASILCSLLAALYPSLKAAHQDPSETLSHS